MKSIITSVLLLTVLAVPFASAEPGKKGQKPDRIAHGERVDVKEYLVPGKTTIVNFTSAYCPPCQRISPLLDELHAQRDDVAVVKVDINRPDVRGIDWKAPVVAQYELRSVPSFQVYDAKGTLIAEGEAAAEMVLGWLQES